MPKLSELVKGVQDVIFDYDGEKLTVTCRANAISLRQASLITDFATIQQRADGSDSQADGSDLQRESDALNSLVRTLVNNVVKWDLLNEDGTMYPITETSLRDLPLRFLFAVFGAMMRGERPNPPSGERSSST